MSPRRWSGYIVGMLLLSLLSTCATDPGSGTPVAGAGVTYFTYETGQVEVLFKLEGSALLAAAILFDTNQLPAIANKLLPSQKM